MKLIVGLGNPGSKYEKTRHNAGFLVVDQILSRNGGSWQGKKFDAEWARITLLGQDCLFLKPQTFMNLSGRSVAQAMRFYKVQVADVLVVYDDVDVPVGKVKTRMDGGPGGHNGIRSLIAELGSDAFARVKLGVGRPTNPAMDVSSFVLADFAASELEQLQGPMVDETILRIQGVFQQKRNA